MTDFYRKDPVQPEDGEIYAGMLSEGTSHLVFHALKPNGNSACSSYLLVVYSGSKAKDIKPEYRCRSKACQRLFAIADGQQP